MKINSTTNLVCEYSIEFFPLEQLGIGFVVELRKVIDGHQVNPLDVVRPQDLAPAWKEPV